MHPKIHDSTTDLFHELDGEVAYDDPHAQMLLPLDELEGISRLIVARLERCAWMDEAMELGLKPDSSTQFACALANADAWRVWELSPSRSQRGCR